jgi:hypothetical protein
MRAYTPNFKAPLMSRPEQMPASIADLIRSIDRQRADLALFYGNLNRQLTAINDRIGALEAMPAKALR